MKTRIAALVLLTAFASVATAQEGAALYKARCSACHGTDGLGHPKTGSKLVGISKSESAIADYLLKGGAPKPPHNKPLPNLQPAQANALAAYVKTLK